MLFPPCDSWNNAELYAGIDAALQNTQEQSLAELNKQLAILQDQDQARLESLQRKPRLVITAGGANLMNRAQKPKPCLPLAGSGDIAGCSIQIENRGDLPFANGRLRIWCDSTDAYVSGSNIEASQLSPKGILANGIEVLLPPIVKGEPPHVAAIQIVIAHKHPINLNLQIVGDGVEKTNLTPMQALPVMDAAN